MKKTMGIESNKNNRQGTPEIHYNAIPGNHTIWTEQIPFIKLI